MKIEITTQREILDCDYWDWITELKRNGIPIDGTELEESKSFTRNKIPLDFEKIYKYHAPKEGQAAKYEALRAKAKELAELVMDLTRALADLRRGRKEL